jgi:hypothetical protein
MVQTLAARRAQAMDLRLASLSGVLGATNSTENMISDAIAFCAQKMGQDSAEAVVDRLRQNDKTVCGYFLHGIAKRLAVSLGAVDEHVRAVYVLDYDATPEDLCFGTLDRGMPLIHLIVWAERKTAALGSLVAALDLALARACADLVGGSAAAGLLDVQVVDDADVENRTGYGALLHSIHHRPIQIWECKAR